MISISNLSKTYYLTQQPVQALSNINLEIKEAEILGIFGKSGSGKSTLLRTLNGLEKPSSGDVFVLGKHILSLSKSNLQQLRREIGIIFQSYHLLNSLTVYKNIALPLEVQGLDQSIIDAKVNELLNFVGLADKKNTKPGYLSGGQRQRVAIARALATNPKILLCDEPTSALDKETSHSILQLLDRINQQYHATIIIISHDEDIVKPYCHRYVRLHNGHLLEDTYVH